ncbi:hypothetical protein RclHR1_26720001 [Rhizophagus clarus]|uniref:Uncharacterized protein n=1 Tax=Rhizophagus clarus TaxID=94130 RepID=A0A2Z6R0Y5_9GLOM|nr:hypothetical protein RclHR1_26720001 [Rhizophagus clarus]GES78990.1 hypothetical protein RCL_jg6019.t1 [Rhizophagus clarus]
MIFDIEDILEETETVFDKIVNIDSKLIFTNHLIQVNSDLEKGLVFKSCEGCHLERNNLGILSMRGWKPSCVIIGATTEAIRISATGQCFKHPENKNYLQPDISGNFIKEIWKMKNDIINNNLNTTKYEIKEHVSKTKTRTSSKDS